VSGDITSVVAGVCGIVATSAGFWLFLRQWLRHRTERNRWSAVERIVERHGPDVLAMLPPLVREIRADGDARGEPKPPPRRRTRTRTPPDDTDRG
jgi:hypothetical protein